MLIKNKYFKVVLELIIYYFINYFFFYGSYKLLRHLTDGKEYNLSVHILIIMVDIFTSIIVICIGLFYLKKSLVDVCLIKKVKLNVWFIVLLCSTGFTIILFYLLEFIFWIFLGWEMFTYRSGAGDISILFVIQTCLIPAIEEEITSKGIINNRLEQIFSRKIAVIISSIIFGLMHLNLVLFLYHFLFSICTFWIYFKTRTILMPMFALFYLIYLHLIFSLI